MLSYDVISTYDGSSTCERKKLDRKNEKSLLCRVLYQILVYNRLSARMVIPCQSLSFFFFFPAWSWHALAPQRYISCLTVYIYHYDIPVPNTRYFFRLLC